jgi:hypothetical protein
VSFVQLQHTTKENNGCADPPLGIHASIVVAPKSDNPRSDAIYRRFKLQRYAQEVLHDYFNPKGKPWRVVNCHNVPVLTNVDIWYHPEHSTASYGGLQTCGSVHTCLVCASKIAARRAEEVNAGVQTWLARGGKVLMATFTLQHTSADSLKDLHTLLNGQYRHMRQVTSWRSLADRVGLVGSITAREYTYGAAGWHPHLHALLFVGDLAGKDLAWVKSSLPARWAQAMKRAGGYAHARYGCTVQLADDGKIGNYLTELQKSWSAGDELARSATKRSRKGGRTIGQVLADAGAGDEHARGLFREYADVTYRQNHIVWSKGLRDLLGAHPEKSDEEIAAEKEAEGILMIQLTREQWRIVVGNDARPDLLIEADAGDIDKVFSFLQGLGITLEPWQVWPKVEPERD